MYDIKNEKVAERLKLLKLKQSQVSPVVGNSNSSDTEIVFGNGKFDYDEDGCDDEEFFDESQMIIEDVLHSSISVLEDTSSNSTAPKREHKKIKQWGKKNRKLRNKNPYDEDSKYSSIHTTDRRVLNKSNKRLQTNAPAALPVERFEPIPLNK